MWNSRTRPSRPYKSILRVEKNLMQFIHPTGRAVVVLRMVTWCSGLILRL